jgi:hypothetical protein
MSKYQNITGRNFLHQVQIYEGYLVPKLKNKSIKELQLYDFYKNGDLSYDLTNVNCSCKLFSVLDGKSLYPSCQTIGGALGYGGTITGKNICLIPSAFIVGKMIPDAP